MCLYYIVVAILVLYNFLPTHSSLLTHSRLYLKAIFKQQQQQLFNCGLTQMWKNLTYFKLWLIDGERESERKKSKKLSPQNFCLLINFETHIHTHTHVKILGELFFSYQATTRPMSKSIKSISLTPCILSQ